MLNFNLNPANAGVLDCLQLGYPTAYLSSSSLSINISYSVNCTREQIGNGGSGIVTSIPEEGFFAQCSGLYFLNPGGLGTITCRVPIGGIAGSTRYGASSTTVKVWTAWDFSTKFVTANHQSIPMREITPSQTTPVSPTTPLQTPNSNSSSSNNQPLKTGNSNSDLLNKLNKLTDEIDSQLSQTEQKLNSRYIVKCKKNQSVKSTYSNFKKCPIGWKYISSKVNK